MSIFENVLADRFAQVAKKNGGELGIFLSPNGLYKVFRYPSGGGQITTECYHCVTGNNIFNKSHPIKVSANVNVLPINRAGLRI